MVLIVICLVPDKFQTELISLLDENGFHNVIGVPTCVTVNSFTLIYVFITNCESRHITSGAILMDISDHFSIFPFVVIRARIPTAPKTNLCCQHITDHTVNLFHEDIAHFGWNVIFKEALADHACDKLILHFQRFYEKRFPYTKVMRNAKSRKHWVMLDILHKIKTKNKLFRNVLRLKTFVCYRNINSTETD